VNPRISIILPVYNGAATIADTLTSLLAQAGLRDSFEILVINNASTDNTAEIVAPFPVTLIHEPRKGASAARNAGLRASQGQIIAYTDADTLPTRRWLAELIRPFNDPAVMIVGGAILSYDPQNAAERYLDASGIYGSHHNVKAKVFPFAVGMNMAVRTSVVRQIGGWEESLLWGEDIDFSHRILRQFPHALAYAPAALLFHRNRSTLDALARQAIGYGRGAAMIYCRFPDIAQWRLLSSLIVMGSLLGRWINVLITKLASTFRFIDSRHAELAFSHALWSWSFWRGFFAEYYWLRTQKKV
jgi:glycosyltransferase involved in cell wall biosynthesis